MSNTKSLCNKRINFHMDCQIVWYEKLDYNLTDPFQQFNLRNFNFHFCFGWIGPAGNKTKWLYFFKFHYTVRKLSLSNFVSITIFLEIRKNLSIAFEQYFLTFYCVWCLIWPTFSFPMPLLRVHQPQNYTKRWGRYCLKPINSHFNGRF